MAATVNRVDWSSVARWIAVGIGSANAAVTGFWLLGGTALLDTVGGEIESWGRGRTIGVLIILGLVLVAKAAVTVLPVAVDRSHGRLRRLGRVIAWTAALLLTMYGGLLTLVGLVIQAGIVERAYDADDRALAWHAYVWDPWFLLWGLALVAWLVLGIDTQGEGSRTNSDGHTVTYHRRFDGSR